MMIGIQFDINFKASDGDTIVLPVVGEESCITLENISNVDCDQLIRHTLENSNFSYKVGEHEIINSPYLTSPKISRVILLGLKSDDKKPEERSAEAAGAYLLSIIKGLKTSRVVIVGGHLSQSSINSLCFGFIEHSWDFKKYKTSIAAKAVCSELLIVSPFAQELSRNFERSKAILDGLFYARSLVAEPSNHLTPAIFMERCKELASLNLEVEVLDTACLENEKMNALLSVAMGSDNPPYLVVIKHIPDPKAVISASFVGKGVCFDAGGISIKSSKDMHKMRYDMAGAAAVVGAMIAIAKQRVNINVVGVIGLVENMPSGKALKPGDVITSASGTTIEVLNTDAEGRLVLADCLHYTEKYFKPQIMIDLATLTPETIGALSDEYAGLYTDDAELATMLSNAGEATGDRVWRLPMGENFRAQIDSKIADIKNLGNEWDGDNGAAAEFLKCFVKGSRWAHLDIAGVAMKETAQYGLEFKINGFGVRLLEEVAVMLSSKC